ncbi:S66 peptidase family protein [Senegalia massiliensis]|uniref:S66 peptidase family protein n=1 Tax=Senegalia massiliensis TaxID=1720316 RepID=UPI001031705A|nr:LD-carboxypeptidase [Senegalia massiliensis]
MIKPKALKKGSTIGLVAPASYALKKDINKSIKFLKGLGFKVKLANNIYSKYYCFAGEDEDRAIGINTMFKDKEVDAIFCIRGGYGVHRILEKIDYEMIKENPKIFMGYSDITALHIAINNNSNLITFHGPMTVSDMKDVLDEFSFKSLEEILMSGKNEIEIINPKDDKIKVLSKGKASGILTGGNLALITGTIGTPYEIDTKDKILFIEDIGEYTFKVDRMLRQIKLAGKLNVLKGIILGDFNNCIKEDDGDQSLMEVFEEMLSPLNIPIVYNIKSGHCTPNITLPLGAKVEIDADNLKLKIIEQVISHE